MFTLDITRPRTTPNIDISHIMSDPRPITGPADGNPAAAPGSDANDTGVIGATTTAEAHSGPGGAIRRDSNNSTVVGNDLATVDTHYAAQLRPSKLHGAKLSIMVNVVAGVGVSRIGSAW